MWTRRSSPPQQPTVRPNALAHSQEQLRSRSWSGCSLRKTSMERLVALTAHAMLIISRFEEDAEQEEAEAEAQSTHSNPLLQRGLLPKSHRIHHNHHQDCHHHHHRLPISTSSPLLVPILSLLSASIIIIIIIPLLLIISIAKGAWERVL